MRSSSPYGRVIDIVVIGLVAALIAIFFTHDGTAIRLLRYARRFSPPWSAAIIRQDSSRISSAMLASTIAANLDRD
jgi:hypothetical protein